MVKKNWQGKNPDPQSRGVVNRGAIKNHRQRSEPEKMGTRRKYDNSQKKGKKRRVEGRGGQGAGTIGLGVSSFVSFLQKKRERTCER